MVIYYFSAGVDIFFFFFLNRMISLKWWVSRLKKIGKKKKKMKRKRFCSECLLEKKMYFRKKKKKPKQSKMNIKYGETWQEKKELCIFLCLRFHNCLEATVALELEYCKSKLYFKKMFIYITSLVKWRHTCIKLDENLIK